MNENQSKPKRRRRYAAPIALILALFASAAIYCLMNAIAFLSVTKRVDADVLVVEAWLSPSLLPPVVDEFHRGHYALLVIAGIQNFPEKDPDAIMGSQRRTLQSLEGLGVPSDKLLPCPAPYAEWHRTAKAAWAVRERIQELGLKPRGINVITEGTHARESWAAYRHIFGRSLPVGIVAVPKAHPPGPFWWTTRGGLIWVTKDILGWLKEIVFPLRF